MFVTFLIIQIFKSWLVRVWLGARTVNNRWCTMLSIHKGMGGEGAHVWIGTGPCYPFRLSRQGEG